jgi:cellulose synthase/poly-beta-1,6-N-acetylglucosamine synthase-like glycosyltransferase
MTILVHILDRLSPRSKRWVLVALIGIGAVLALHFLYRCWGLIAGAGYPAWAVMLFAISVVGVAIQPFFVWYLYLQFRQRPIPEPRPDVSVDIFVTAYDEDESLVASTLRAAIAVAYPHRTWLLDDSSNSRYHAVAEQMGCEHLTRRGNGNQKAGNINAALARTSGDFVAIFDADHAPVPAFLHRTLGFFEDASVGFVQVMQTFSNAREGLIATASAETALEYFNVTAVCNDALGATSLHGTNAVIRRSALESIGGYRPGLAEDLETSIALHAGGWRSAYVCEPLAPGLTPSSFTAFCKQQSKWSRGVFEAAIRSISDGSYFQLTWIQRLAYAVRFSYYIVGLAVFLGLALTVAYLLLPPAASRGYEASLRTLLPVFVATFAIRWFMLSAWATEPAARRGIHFRGTSLVFSIWPIYLRSFIYALLRIPIPFISTPKTNNAGIRIQTVAAQFVMQGVLAIALVWRIMAWSIADAPATFAMGVLFLCQPWILLSPAVLGAVWAQASKRGRLLARAERPVLGR